MLTIPVWGSFAEVKNSILEANKKGKAIEFRLDLFEDLTHVAKLKEFSSLPVIFTLRKASQGGKFLGSEREWEKKILELLVLAPDYVDLEYGSDLSFVEKVHQTYPKVSVICSYHDFTKTPEHLPMVLDKMTEMRASLYKIATFANTTLDSLRMLIFIQQQRKQGKSIAGMCMGPEGEVTRILAPIVDNLLTYAPLSTERETAQGQISLDTLEKIYHFSRLNQQTRIYALIGDPIEKSIGHLTHNTIFQKLRQNAVYVKLRLKPKEVVEFFRLMKALPFHGFSVTMPLKEQVGHYLDYIDPEAKTIGAINTLNFAKGKWEGFNTDASAALDAIETKGKIAHKKIVILGAGGAARALAYESLKRGGNVLIVNRTGDKAKQLAKQLGCEGMALEDWTLFSYDILMNTIPISMSLKANCFISKEAIQIGAIIFDAIIDPKETYLLTLAKRKNCQIVYGYEMYARQAIKQLIIWFNLPLDQNNLLQDIAHIYHTRMSF